MVIRIMSAVSHQICKILKIFSGLWLSIVATSLGIAIPALSQTSTNQLNPVIAEEPGISLPPNISQFLTDYGLTPVKCSSETASLQLETNKICVRGRGLKPGEYIYDSATDEIKPLQNQTHPESPVQSQPGSRQMKSQYTFTFTNVQQYSNCLEDIIQLYKDKERFRRQGRRSTCLADIFQKNSEQGLSKDQALELIRTADSYATSSFLVVPLYPPRGIRRRIAQEFGFIYKLDADDQDLQRLERQKVPVGQQ
jgi:hypothetical protein